jgi:Ca-activated chloride channel homolog
VRRLLTAALCTLGAFQQVPVFKTGIDIVNVAAVVTDNKGNLVTNLLRDDFELFDNGKKQAISYFTRGDDDAAMQPELHLGLLLDVSESMGEDLGFIKTAAIKFMNRLADAKDITVIDFDTEVRAARYSQNEFARAIERIRSKKVAGFTAIHDAVGLYLDGAGGQDGRKVMVLYTDGGDTRSTLSFTQLVDLLKASDVTVYVVGMLEHQPSFSKNQQRMTMLQIAEVTGGQALFPTSVKELDEMYDKILAQYTLGYTPAEAKNDGKWRRVEIKARKDSRGLRVQSRKGYFAPYKP